MNFLAEIFGFDMKDKIMALKSWPSYAYLLSGVFFIIGLPAPELNFLFYLSFVFPAWALYKDRATKAGMVYFWLPYGLVVGLGAWLAVFPYYLGLALGILFAFPVGHLFYILQTKARIPLRKTLLLPAGFFLYDFIFHSVPYLEFVELPLTLGLIYNHTWLIRVALLLGSSLSLFLVVLLVNTLAVMALERKFADYKLGVIFGGIALIAAANILSGSSIAPEGQGVKVAAVQASTYSEAVELQGEEYVDYIFSRYVSMIEGEEADIFLFPEVPAAYYYPENEEYRGQRFMDLARDKGSLIIPVVLEYKEAARGTEGREEKLLQFITALVVSEEGFLGKSSKRNLVPFTEAKHNSAGTDYESIPTEYGDVGISICYDMNSFTLPRLKQNGAEIILAPFNNAGFSILFHRMHAQYPVFKALKYNIPIVVANENGISQIVDRDGRVLERLEVNEKGVIKSEFYFERAPSYYLAAGRYVELLLAFALLASFLATDKRSIFRKRSCIE